VCAAQVCVVNVDRLSLAPSSELGALIRSSAAGAGESVSAWLIGAAKMRMRSDLGECRTAAAPWQGTSMSVFEQMEAEQNQLAGQVELVNRVDVTTLGLVAGVDTAYWSDSDGVEHGVCSIVVVDYASHQVVRTVHASGVVTVPYRAGFLAFRELPLLEAAVAQLDVDVDLFMFDGNGQLHPRRMGIATHASFALGCPTIGVAKTYYRVGDDDFVAPADEPGAWTPVTIDGQVLGAAVRTRRGVKPVFVSCGNWIDLPTAITVTTALVEPTSRLPVPLRAADLDTRSRRATLLGTGSR